eukprot:COSAG06_NODE_310_length_17775_cov_9.971374_8_plen_52_part_00
MQNLGDYYAIRINAGGEIVKGSIVATVDEDGALDMRYQHVNTAGDLMVRIY